MQEAHQESTTVSLESLCHHVEQWRAHRERPKSRVPEELWNEAVSVARVLGPWATCRAIHFNYMDLKQRMSQAESQSAEPSKAEFVELQMAAIEQRQEEGRIVVELQDHRGDRMRIETSCGALDLQGMVQAFWRRSS
jgi:hypothetical protein